MRLQVFSVAIDTTGGAGAATGSGVLPISVVGYLEYLYYDFHASAPATTDVTITYPNTPPGGQVHKTTDTATDVLAFPRAKCVDNANAAITNSFDRFPISGPLNVAVAQCDALTGAVTVYAGILTDD